MTYFQADAVLAEWFDVTWEAMPFSFCVDPAGFLAVPPTATLDNREVSSQARPDPDLLGDDPLSVLRLYFVIDVSTLAATPTEAQWHALITQTKTKMLSAGIIALARSTKNYINASFRAQGTGLMKYTLGGFEINADDKDEALALLNSAATTYSVTGNATEKFAGCVQTELRAAALDLGYSAAQANKINVAVVNEPGAFDRASAIEAVQAYLAANAAVWYA
jgi:hypothetical protein